MTFQVKPDYNMQGHPTEDGDFILLCSVIPRFDCIDTRTETHVRFVDVIFTKQQAKELIEVLKDQLKL